MPVEVTARANAAASTRRVLLSLFCLCLVSRPHSTHCQDSHCKSAIRPAALNTTRVFNITPSYDPDAVKAKLQISVPNTDTFVVLGPSNTSTSRHGEYTWQLLQLLLVEPLTTTALTILADPADDIVIRCDPTDAKVSVFKAAYPTIRCLSGVTLDGCSVLWFGQQYDMQQTDPVLSNVTFRNASAAFTETIVPLGHPLRVENLVMRDVQTRPPFSSLGLDLHTFVLQFTSSPASVHLSDVAFHRCGYPCLGVYAPTKEAGATELNVSALRVTETAANASEQNQDAALVLFSVTHSKSTVLTVSDVYMADNDFSALAATALSASLILVDGPGSPAAPRVSLAGAQFLRNRATPVHARGTTLTGGLVVDGNTPCQWLRSVAAVATATATGLAVSGTSEFGLVDFDIAHKESAAETAADSYPLNPAWAEVTVVQSARFNVTNVRLTGVAGVTRLRLTSIAVASIDGLVMSDNVAFAVQDSSSAAAAAVAVSGGLVATDTRLEISASRIERNNLRDDYGGLVTAGGGGGGAGGVRYSSAVSNASRCMLAGALLAHNTTVLLRNVTVADNVVVVSGVSAAVLVVEHAPSFVADDVRLADNAGTPLRVAAVTNVTMTSVTVTGNAATVGGGRSDGDAAAVSAGVALAGVTMATIASSNFSRNTLVTKGVPGSGGCLLVDFAGMAGATVVISDSQFSECRVNATYESTSASSENRKWYYGGGVHAHFGAGSLNGSMAMSRCAFGANRAVHGGAVGVMFSDGAAGNVVTIDGGGSGNGDGEEFANNVAAGNDRAPEEDDDVQGTGGAIAVAFFDGSSDNDFRLTGHRFVANKAASGGGLYALFYDDYLTHSFNVTRCSFTDNEALTGSAILLASTKLCQAGDVELSDLTFDGNMAYDCGALAASSIHFTMHGRFLFRNNYNSALYLQDAFCNFSADAQFNDNKAHAGGAIYSISSRMFIDPHSKARFRNNLAVSVGGGIYAYVEVRAAQITLNRTCFIEGNASQLLDSVYTWANFSENYAGLAGSAVYVNDVRPCLALDDLPEKILHYISWYYPNNFIIPKLYSDFNSWTASQATPGGTLNQLMQWRTDRWDAERLVRIADVAEEYGAESKMNTSTISTDISNLYIITKEDAGRISSLDKYCSKANQKEFAGSGRLIKLNGAGMLNHIYGFACDQLGQLREALLSLSIEEPRYNSMERRARPDPSWPNTSDFEARLVLDKASTTVGLLKTKDACRTEVVIFNIVDKFKEPPSSPTNVTVQVVGASNYVQARIAVTLSDCPACYTMAVKSFTDAAGKTLNQSQCVCASPTHPFIRQCDMSTNKVYLAHGYMVVKNPNSSVWEVLLCPPNFCGCNGNGVEQGVCEVDLDDLSAQCLPGRSGERCSTCAGNDTVSVMDGYSVHCQKKTDCDSWAKAVGLSMLLGFGIDAAVLTLNMPLSNDIKGLLFHQSVVYFLLYESDPFLDKIVGEGNDTWRWIRAMWSVSTLNYPGYCFYPVNNMLESIAFRYILPSMMFFMLIPMLLVLRFWMNKFRFFPIFDGTWLLLYIPFSHTLETSIRLLAYTDILKRTTFFYDTSYNYFEGPHKVVAVIAVAMLAILVVFIATVAWLCTDKPIPKFAREVARLSRVALRMGLKDKPFAKQWWTVDLLRRTAIILLFMQGPLPEDVKHALIMTAVLACLLFHAWVWPYTPASDDVDSDDGSRSTAFVGMVPFLRGANRCNYFEAAVLTNMLLVCFLTSAPNSGPGFLVSTQREALLAFLTTWPTILFYAFLLYKVVVNSVYRLVPARRRAAVEAVVRRGINDTSGSSYGDIDNDEGGAEVDYDDPQWCRGGSHCSGDRSIQHAADPRGGDGGCVLTMHGRETDPLIPSEANASTSASPV